MSSFRNPASTSTWLYSCWTLPGRVSSHSCSIPLLESIPCLTKNHEFGAVQYMCYSSSNKPNKLFAGLSYFEILKEQLKHVEKMKDNVVNMVSNANVVATFVPTKVPNDAQKHIPLHIRFKDQLSVRNSKSPPAIQVSQKKEKSQKIIKPEISSTVDSGHNHMFYQVMIDTSDSVDSFHVDGVKDVKKPTTTKNKSIKASNVGPIPNKSTKTPTKMTKKKAHVDKDFVSKTAIEGRARALVHSIKTASSISSKYTRTEELCKHLLQHPNSRTVATKEMVLPYLLKFRTSKDQSLRELSREALSLIGYVCPVKGQGIRLLSIDGGGTKGLVAIECMKRLEELCGQNIHEMFDYVCGVSTGALVAAMAFLYRVPLDECEYLYKEFSRRMFTRNRLLGTGQLVWNHAFYDSEIWENILKEEIGDKKMVSFSQTPNTPKMSAMSCIMNTPKMKMYFFRNYNLPPGVNSQYPGNCHHEMWEVIRASTAAPGYFESYVKDNVVHQDGGLMANNPAALAVHESKLLWPNTPFQCVISLGTGQHLPSLEYSSTKLALKDKVMKIVDSATDTEAVHMTLQDLLPHSTYFRLNPYLSEDFLLDEIRVDKVDQMQHDTRMYLRKNEIKVNKAVNQLTRKRKVHQKVGDYVKSMRDKL